MKNDEKLCRRLLFSYPISIFPSSVTEFLAEELSEHPLQVSKMKVAGIFMHWSFKKSFFSSLHFFVSLPTLWTFNLQLWQFYGDFENDIWVLRVMEWKYRVSLYLTLILWNSHTNSGLPTSCISLYKIKLICWCCCHFVIDAKYY